MLCASNDSVVRIPGVTKTLKMITEGRMCAICISEVYASFLQHNGDEKSK